MNTAQRRAANDESLQHFLSSYDQRWRLTKILAIELSLEQRDALVRKLKNSGYPDDDLEAYVYQQATNGLVSSALSETVMYCEDFLALLKVIREPETFVQKMTTYSAGTISSFANRLIKAEDDEILRVFMVPSRDYVASLPRWEEVQDTVMRAHERLVTLTREVAQFYLDHLFFHDQYKHGLKLPLAPFAQTLPQEWVDERKHDLFGTVIAYDNSSLENALKKSRLDKSAPMWKMGPATQPFLTELDENRGLLRYYMLREVRIADLVIVGKKIWSLLQCLISNRLDLINPIDPHTNKVSLPEVEYPKVVEMQVIGTDRALGLANFAGDI